MLAELKPYPEYVAANIPGVNAVPVHWQAARIKTALRELDRRSRDGSGTLLSLTRVRGLIRQSEMTSKATSAATLEGYKLYRPGEIVMNRMQAWSGMFGTGPEEGLVSPDYAVFRVLEGNDPAFLVHLLRSPAMVAQFAVESKGIGSGFNRLYTDKFGAISLPLPPPAEQAGIVRFLGAVDRKVNRFIRAKRRLIEVLTEQKQAIITHAVTKGLNPHAPGARFKPSGIDWLGDVPAHWEVAALRLRYDQCLGKMLDAKRITGEHLVPYLRNTDVQWDRINTDNLPQMDIEPHELSRFTVQPGDLLVCEGGDVGRCAFWRGQLATCGFQKALHRLRALQPTRDYPRFLYYLMFLASKLGVFVASGSESTIAHLTGDKLRAHRFVFPPRAEQEAIARYLDAELRTLEDAMQVIRREIDLIREYRTRLVADVVTGKVDVRAVAAALPDEPAADDPTPDDDAQGADAEGGADAGGDEPEHAPRPGEEVEA